MLISEAPPLGELWDPEAAAERSQPPASWRLRSPPSSLLSPADLRPRCSLLTFESQAELARFRSWECVPSGALKMFKGEVTTCIPCQTLATIITFTSRPHRAVLLSKHLALTSATALPDTFVDET
ncbi:unnamed protein product [Rangifer tarandus platyrhynchus]|uniref:Uncharacterized protein n=2 Tax=Rangifer tarandus platyrhynchus TaxID=3082113 RepID=A0ACB0FMZ8_RANTA|nr:unnamed protein product [Rangifer tarandus platyrhynchus]CAI9714296.1 unnamed protein product [Rangifer tarandus platyrhynchus]